MLVYFRPTLKLFLLSYSKRQGKKLNFLTDKVFFRKEVWTRSLTPSAVLLPRGPRSSLLKDKIRTHGCIRPVTLEKCYLNCWEMQFILIITLHIINREKEKTVLHGVLGNVFITQFLTTQSSYDCYNCCEFILCDCDV